MPHHGLSLSELSPSTVPGLSSLQSHLFRIRFRQDESGLSPLSYRFEDLPSPFLLPDLEGSLELIRRFVKENKTILLFGDRDSDGVSSTSLLGSFLRKVHSGNLIIKTSSNEDYGLCAPAMKFIRDAKPDLLITLDFGTSNSSEIDELTKEGIQVIVLDHHEIPARISPSGKLISPKRGDSRYPYEKICTSLIAWKLVTGWLYESLTEASHYVWVKDTETLFEGSLVHKGVRLFQGDRASAEKIYPIPFVDWQERVNDEYPERSVFFSQISRYPGILNEILMNLDLAAVGTITDMMPLAGENRIIVQRGCETLQKIRTGEYSHRPGLNQLMKLLELSKRKITSKDLGWSIGPALNAAGRMHKTETALKLLLSESESEAESLSKDLLKLNEERRERTKRNLFRVDGFLKRKKERTERPVIFCYEPDFEPGVSGIVATRLVEQYRRPVIFIAPDHGHAKGSIRAYGSENVLNLLKKAEPIFQQFGGHKEAGGFSLPIEKIPELAEILFKEAELWLKEEKNLSTQAVEESIVSLHPAELKDSIHKELGIFEPFGQGNPTPILSVKGARILSYRPLSEGKHARFKLLSASDSIHCIIWNRAGEFTEVLRDKESLDLWGYLEENTFRGKTTLQFVITAFS
ncbi:single-stranded-DNA-specific exonuclease RecJ [Leptospira inadai serovar Lyme str. 10]|uniref:Single-stranded-DNA-specific exonuclease RecJ n=2 Tax=Leptospira inadai serovar Lyme TaxID=293084 RepID=V6HBB4_9LEPT|nr:single-stranded-DNA-specific exonuclease RecJ [Leptospira inadai]EQA36891.1 single-stranded-DNA-specific exonuclease RecJ [Leptospira inadai serovar Lyme str. 10]PNV76462.1 single-stranded-DNA-specific exonuclease RecJ [Leptospira inadai serovar Lyme]